MNKSDLRKALIGRLQADLELQTRAAHLARDEAISEESRAESKWDTRGQEAAYLAEGQARLAAELREAIAQWRAMEITERPPPSPIDIGSVFAIELSSGQLRGVMGPRSGGTEFLFDGEIYTVVTPVSPLGRSVMGKAAGDEVELRVGRKPRPHRIEMTW